MAERGCACDGVGMCSEHIENMLKQHPLPDGEARYNFLRAWLRAEPGTEADMPDGWLTFDDEQFNAAIDAGIRLQQPAAERPEGETNG